MDALNPHRSLRWSFLGKYLLGVMAWLGLSLGTAVAQTNGTWTNDTSGTSLWATPVNWSNSTAASGAGSTATITVANNAASKTISLNNTTQTNGILNIGNPNGTGAYTLSTGAMIFDNNGSSAQINIASGSGAVTLASTLTNTINNSLLLSQNSSSLLTFNSTITGGSGSGNKVIEHAGTGTGGIRITNVIANGAVGTVSVRQNNANGTLDLRSTNTYTGGTVVDAGTLTLASGTGDNRLAATGAVTVNGGILNFGAFSNTVGAVSVNGGTMTNGTLSGSSYSVTGGTITTVLAGAGALTKSGAGTTTLSGSNTYTGGTTVNAGTLTLGAGDNRLATTGAVTVNGGILNFGAFSNTVGAVSVNGGILTNGTLSGSSYAVTGGTIAAILAGGALTKSGSGTATLSGVNTYTGGTAINGGVLSVSSRDNFANRLLSFDGGTLEATANISGFTSVNNTTLNAGGGTIRVGTGLNVDWGTAIISGTGGLTKDGAGTLVLASGAVGNNYTGGTTINQGVVSISRVTGLGNATNSVTFNGGTLLTTTTLTNSRSTTLGASGGTFETAAATTNNWNGSVSGDGQLTKTGVGQLSLNATNVYRGDTLLKSGTLLVGSSGAIASSSRTFVDGGLLKVNGTAGAVTVNTGGSLGGSGSVGALTLRSGSLLSPGNSPGLLTASSATVLGGSTYNWEISALTGTAGTNWDILSVNGLLDMTGVTSSSKWNLVITADSGFTGWTDSNSYSYVFAQAASTSGFSNVDGTDITSLFNITTSGISNLPNSSSTPAGEFKVTVGSAGGLTTLNLNAIPEPSASSLMGIGLVSLIVLRRFRRRES